MRQVNEGENFVFDCTVEAGPRPVFFILLDGSAISDRLSLLESIPGGSRYTFGPVNRSDNGSVLQCSVGDTRSVESATLDVTCEWYSCVWSLHTAQIA